MNESHQRNEVSRERALYSSYSERDVLSGRGGLTNRASGNRIYRRIIQHNKPIYRSITQKRRQTLFVLSIVQAIRASGGRFLKRRGDMWEELSEEEAMEKVKQAIREPDSKYAATSAIMQSQRSFSCSSVEAGEISSDPAAQCGHQEHINLSANGEGQIPAVSTSFDEFMLGRDNDGTLRPSQQGDHAALPTLDEHLFDVFDDDTEVEMPQSSCPSDNALWWSRTDTQVYSRGPLDPAEASLVPSAPLYGNQLLQLQPNQSRLPSIVSGSEQPPPLRRQTHICFNQFDQSQQPSDKGP